MHILFDFDHCEASSKLGLPCRLLLLLLPLPPPPRQRTAHVSNRSNKLLELVNVSSLSLFIRLMASTRCPLRFVVAGLAACLAGWLAPGCLASLLPLNRAPRIFLQLLQLSSLRALLCTLAPEKCAEATSAACDLFLRLRRRSSSTREREREDGIYTVPLRVSAVARKLARSRGRGRYWRG